MSLKTSYQRLKWKMCTMGLKGSKCRYHEQVYNQGATNSRDVDRGEILLPTPDTINPIL